MSTSTSNLQVLARLENFLSQSKELLTLAQNDQWEEFEILMAQRQETLPSLSDNEFIIDIARANLAAEAKHLISEIQNTDQQILALAEKSKQAIAEKLSSSIKATKAIVAYKS